MEVDNTQIQLNEQSYQLVELRNKIALKSREGERALNSLLQTFQLLLRVLKEPQTPSTDQIKMCTDHLKNTILQLEQIISELQVCDLHCNLIDSGFIIYST